METEFQFIQFLLYVLKSFKIDLVLSMRGSFLIIFNKIFQKIANALKLLSIHELLFQLLHILCHQFELSRKLFKLGLIGV